MASEEQGPTPWTDLAPVDIALLKDSGVPDDAIIGERLDVDLLRRLGWTVGEDSLAAPGDHED